jgi:hypothetical protein
MLVWMKRLAAIVLFTCLLGVTPAEGVPPTDIATGTAEPADTSARVVGYWNYGPTSPPGIPTDCWFDYGTTLAYGSRTTAICSGTSYATLAPLLPGTTYHYRAAGSNSDGTTYGPDKTFTTLGTLPPPGSPPPPATPSATLKLVAGQSLASVRRHGLRLRVTLTGPCPCVVRGKLLVSGNTAALSRVERVAPGTAKVTLRLKASVKRKLRRARSLKATARVTATAGSGPPTVLSRSLRLR